MTTTHKTRESSGPWWRYGHMWLVVSGPLVVVVAAFVTLWIAVTMPDPVLTEEYYHQGAKAHEALAPGKAGLPALQGRNHAASPEPAPAP